MRAPYSAVIFKAHGVLPAITAQFPLAPGFVYVILAVDVFLPGFGGGSAQLYDDDNVTWWSDQQESASNGLWLNYRGRQVFLGGESVFFRCTILGAIGPDVGADVRASGYRLVTP